MGQGELKLYTYVVRHDTGFAPNPFWEYLTIATCKPQIRRVSEIGDWIAGTGSVKNAGRGRLVFAMRVDEKLTFDEYDRDARFRKKKPNLGGSEKERCGDNIYYRGGNGGWRIRQSYHRHAQMEHDLGGKYVLASGHFYYFGRDAASLPTEFCGLFPRGQGHRCRFDRRIVERFIEWLERDFERGVHGDPAGGDFQ